MNQIPEFAQDMAQHCVAFRVRKLNRKMNRLFNDGLKSYKIQVGQVNMLVALAHFPQGTTPSQIGEALEMEKSTISRNMNVLVKNGWATAEEDTVAGGLRYTLSKQGHELLENVYPLWQEANEMAKNMVIAANAELQLAN